MCQEFAPQLRYEFVGTKYGADGRLIVIYWDTLNLVYTYALVTASELTMQGGFDTAAAALGDGVRATRQEED